MSSIFSRIVAGELSCHRIYEDDRHLAFLDLRPVQPGHTLVIPKREVSYLFDLDEAEHAALWAVAHRVGRHLKAKLACQRICVAVVGYEVPHAHIHLVPTDRITDFPWRGGVPADPAALAVMASKLAGLMPNP